MTAPERGRGARPHDPGLSGDRTALAWSRSALSIAGAGILTARAALAARLWVLGVLAGMTLAGLSVVVYRHGLGLYLGRRLPGALRHHQAETFRLLTAVTLLTAAVAGVVVVVANG